MNRNELTLTCFSTAIQMRSFALCFLFSTQLLTGANTRGQDFDLSPLHTNTGVVDGLDFPERPRGIQRFSKSTGSVGSADVYDGTIYAHKQGLTIYAIRVADGNVIWKTRADDTVTGVVCARDVNNDLVLVSTYKGISGFRRNTGAQQWGRSIKHGLARSTVLGDRIYAGGYDGNVYCIDIGGGNIHWKHNFLKDAPADPPGFDGESARFGEKPARPREISCDGETMFLSVFDQCRMIALDCETGQRKWDFRTKGWTLGRPTITDKYAFLGSQDKHFYCVNKRTGELVWKYKTKARIEGPCAVKDDRVFFSSCDANLYCANLSTGQILWTYATQKRKKYGGPIYRQPIVSGNQVYLATMEGQIYAFKADSGDLLWKLRPSNKSEIDGSLTDGKRLFITTRLNYDDQGEDALYVIGK